MFKNVVAAMLKHKQLVLAAMVVTALSGMVVQPIIPVAQAQLGSDIASDVLDSVFGGGDDDEAAAEDDGGDGGDTQGDDSQSIDQTAEQENEQEQEAEQEVEQNNDQSETNVQANELDTGDNTATVTQANAAEQEVEADAEAAAAAEADSEAESEDDDDNHDGKDKKHHYSGSSDSDSDTTSSVADAEAIANAAAEATGIIEQDNDATVTQDSSIHDVDLSNNVQFGDDTNEQVAIPIIDQDQRAANLAIQAAANLDLDEEIDDYGLVDDGADGDDGDDGFIIVCERQGGANSPIGNVIVIPAGSTPPEGFSEENCESRDPGN